jgi:hypothetical protein
MTRRNSRRINSEQEEIKQIKKPRQTSEDNPFGLSFVVATEVVELPSKGKYYDQESSLYGISELEIKHMTAKEEDLLVNENYIKKGTVLDKLLECLLVDKSIKITDLIADDKYALLTSARITGYGPGYIFKAKCSSCSTEFDFDFDLQAMLDADVVQELPEDVTETDEGIFEFQIETKDLTVGIRILTLEEINYMSQQAERRKELNISGSETVDFLNMIVDHVGGYSDRAILSKLFEVLPIKDVRRIRKIYKAVSPSLNQKQTRTCPSCSAPNEREVPFSLGWFWPDARVY